MKARKRILGLLLALCLVVGQMAGMAFAEDTDAKSTAHVLSNQLTAGQYYKVSTDGTLESGSSSDYNIYYTEETDKYVMTLNNFVLDNTYGGISYSNYGTTEQKPLEIVLIGKNSVKVADGAGNLNAVFVQGKVTFKGDGELYAAAGTLIGSSSLNASAISVSGGDIIIESGTITAIGGSAEAASAGLYMEQGGNIYVNGGTLYANCAVENGEVVDKSGTVTSGNSAGICNMTLDDDETNGNIIISGGIVYAYGGEASYVSGGIVSQGEIKISGGTIYAVGKESSDGNSYGIGAKEDLTISNATIEAIGGKSVTGRSHGIGTEGVLNIESGDIKATGGEANGNSYGIGAVGDMTIGSATIESTGGKSGTESSFGIGTEGVLNIENANITATGGEGYARSHGIGSEKDININGEYVTAKSGKAPYAFGIGANGKISILNIGNITAESVFQALGAVQGIVLGETHRIKLGNSADDAVVLDKIPDRFAGYKYIEVEPKYTVTVNSGTGSGKYYEGDVVGITADEIVGEKQFKEWTVVSGEVSFVDATSYKTTFIMPDGNVEIIATYEDIPEETTTEEETEEATEEETEEATEETTEEETTEKEVETEAKEEETEEKENETVENVAQTGDYTEMSYLIVLMLVAVTIVVAGKKKENV